MIAIILAGIAWNTKFICCAFSSLETAPIQLIHMKKLHTMQWKTKLKQPSRPSEKNTIRKQNMLDWVFNVPKSINHLGG